MAHTAEAPANAADIKEIVALAHQARGVTFETIKVPQGFDPNQSLPAEIPIAIAHGTSPGMQSVLRELEAYRLRPQFKRGTAKAQTLESFIALTNRHKTGHSAIFADTNWRKPSLTTVVDYHDINSTLPAFGKHRIAYEFPLSEEWQAWVNGNGQRMEQAEFAAFLEDRIPELASPLDAERAEWERTFDVKVASPSEIIQLSRGLQVNVASRVKNTQTLNSGEGSIVFEEEHHDASGAPLKVPGMFCLSVPVFFSGEPTRVPVRLRYRVAGGKVSWFYQIYRPDLAVTLRVRDDLADAAGAAALPSFEATPEV